MPVRKNKVTRKGSGNDGKPESAGPGEQYRRTTREIHAAGQVTVDEIRKIHEKMTRSSEEKIPLKDIIGLRAVVGNVTKLWPIIEDFDFSGIDLSLAHTGVSLLFLPDNPKFTFDENTLFSLEKGEMGEPSAQQKATEILEKRKQHCPDRL